MAERVVRVRLAAEIADFKAGMEEAAQRTRELGSESEKLAQKREAFNQLGTAALGIGTAMTTMSVLTVKAAMGWESAWAGVTKTVEGTPEQLAQVEEGLRGLTSVLPASHDEIAGVAEAAGQLGIQTPNVVSFTKTMIDLGETTNLSANDAATALARLTNIMGTSQDEVSNLGSALVGLGNNYATTESEILEMSMRLAGAGKQIGLSEGDVLGLATALSSVGIEAEAGGSAMSKVMIDIAASVEEGGDRLDLFAKTAGVSAQQFATQWRSAPSEALALFVKGLSNAESQGSSTLGVLSELGITEVRMRDALLRSASAADQFSTAMADGNEAFEENNALANEAAKRYETVEARMAIAMNTVRDTAISFGEVLLPALGDAADGLADFAGFLGDIPDPAKQIVAVLTGVVGVTALVGGAALLATPKVIAFKLAMESVGVTGASARASLGSMWRFLTGPYGIALVAATAAVVGLSAAQDALRTSTEEFQSIIRNAKTVDDLFGAADSAVPFLSQMAAATESVEKFKSNLDIIRNNPFLAGLRIETDQLRASLKTMGEELATTAQSDLPSAQKAFSLLATEMELTKSQQLDLLHQMPGYRDALEKQAWEQDILKSSMSETERAQTLLSMAMGDSVDPAAESEAALAALEEEAAEADAALQGTADSLDRIAETAMSMSEANDAALSSINSLTEAAEAEGAAIDGTNEASIRLRDSVREVEQSHRDSAQAILENGGTLAEATTEWQKGRDAVIDMLVAKGMDREEAVRWADQQLGSASAVKGGINEVYRAWLNLPENKETKYKVEKAEAEAALDALKAKLASIPSYRRITLEGFTVGNFDVTPNANGGIYHNKIKAFAAGGFEPGIYPHTPGGIHKFAEEYSEVYISGDPARKSRSQAVWLRAGQEFGFQQHPAQGPVQAGPLIGGDLVLQSTGQTGSDLDLVNFRLRAIQRGGRNGR